MKINWDYVSELMRIFSAIAGVLAGIGFLFVGFNRHNVVISLLALVALFAGFIAIPTLLSEKDEYEITPKNPKKSVRPSAR